MTEKKSHISANSEELKFYYNKEDYITYVKLGKGKSILLFLHGFGESKYSWEDIYPMFDKEIHTIYLMDLKGFGNSSIPFDNQYSPNDNKNIIEQFINKNVHHDYSLIGHSYGGGISLLLSTSDQLINKPINLILIDCAAYNIDKPFFIKYLIYPFLSQAMYLVSTPKLRAKYTLHKVIEKENFNKNILRRYIESFDGKGKKYSFLETAKQVEPKNYKDVIAKYDTIDIPTLIIWGENDKILSKKQGELLSQQIKDSQFKIIHQCGHAPHEEKPKETFNMINEFIGNIKR